MVCQSQPQFLLFCDAHASDAPQTAASNGTYGRWHFVLDRLDHPEHLEAADSEPAIHPDRLALLSVVRGLEALDEPSCVNLVTTSRYVSRGLKYGLSNWRESDYHWERFGIQKPIRNADLWQRVDQALKFHGVTCRLLQANSASGDSPADEAGGEYPLADTTEAPAHPRPPNHQAVTGHQPRVPVAIAPQGAPDGCVQRTAEKRIGAAETQPTLAPASPNSRHDTTSERRLHGSSPAIDYLDNWWRGALTWFKWWRGRHHPRAVYFGT